MNHLSPAEFIDAADGTLTAGRTAHLERCDRCRAQASVVRSTIDAAQTSGVPEPSPLYWPHMAASVRDRIASEPPPQASWWQDAGIRRLAPIAAVAALVAVVVAPVLMPGAGRIAPVVYAPAADVAAADPAAAQEDSEVWDVLTSAAADAPIEDTHAAGMTVTAGAIDRAVQRMSPEELTALGQLLQSELRGSGE